MSTASDSGQSMSAAFIEEIRQKLGLNLPSLVTNAKAAATYLTPAAAAAAYQPLSLFIAQKVYGNGALLSSPKIAAGNASITSTGSYGPYSINFSPVTFASTPIVIASASLTSASLFVTVAAVSPTATGFQVYLQAFNPGQVVIPSSQTIVVEWIAVGV